MLPPYIPSVWLATHGQAAAGHLFSCSHTGHLVQERLVCASTASPPITYQLAGLQQSQGLQLLHLKAGSADRWGKAGQL